MIPKVLVTIVEFQVRRLLLGMAVVQYLIGNYKDEYYNMLKGENIDCIS